MGLSLFLALTILAVWLLIAASRAEDRVSRQWIFVMDATAQDKYRTLQSQLAGEQSLEDQHDARGKMLEAGLVLVEGHGRGLVDMLQGLARVSRMAEAVAPVAPFPIRVWSYPPNRGIARAGMVLRAFLISTGERLRLRLWLLRNVVRLSVRALRGRHMDRARSDLRGAREEALVSAEAVFRSLCARRTP